MGRSVRPRRCSVRYALRLNTELGYDFFLVEASTDGKNWDVVGAWTGTTSNPQSGYVLLEDDLSAYDGSPSVFLRFGLVSDEILHGDGALVDEVDVHCVSTNYGAGSYFSISGTSIAAAHVSGVAALEELTASAAAAAQPPSRTALRAQAPVLGLVSPARAAPASPRAPHGRHRRRPGRTGCPRSA